MKKTYRIVEVDGDLPQTPRDLRKGAIMAAAIEVFATEGFAAFSARSVAKKVGVALSTVQHYFPSRETLLVETLREMGNRYIETYRAMGASSLAPRERLLLILDHLLDETLRPDVRAFFFQMWALAQHEPAVAALLEAQYTDYRMVLTELVQAITPAFDREAAAVAATLIAAQIEGLMVISYCGGPNLPDAPQLAARARQVCLDLCKPGAELNVTARNG